MIDLTSFLSTKLCEFGYKGEFQVEYSFNYTQGDGCRFIGMLDISPEIIERFIQEMKATLGTGFVQEVKAPRYRRIFSELYSLIQQWGDNHLSIEANSHRYFHENTMYLKSGWDIARIQEDEINLNTAANINVLEKVQDEFIHWLREDIKYVSRQLTHFGYSILNNRVTDEVLWSFKTQNYEWVLEAITKDQNMESDFLDARTYTCMLDGNHHYGDLLLTLFDRNTEQESRLASASADDVIWNKEDHTFAGIRRALVQEISFEFVNK
ncbi:hypothetical protein [Photobacterium ganghwense]|uniref:hypothetical protein n=1 Tax=Photobacterium ganghwense TaxID=320778 RepID=UPI001A8F962F|nr:hypothetical protein [Photobacterium ganghwense]QSV17631.1 hypothetical protein FH974_25415 [Photobacterium ganghwense]